jgi:hypothetical protein
MRSETSPTLPPPGVRLLVATFVVVTPERKAASQGDSRDRVVSPTRVPSSSSPSSSSSSFFTLPPSVASLLPIACGCRATLGAATVTVATASDIITTARGRGQPQVEQKRPVEATRVTLAASQMSVHPCHVVDGSRYRVIPFRWRAAQRGEPRPYVGREVGHLPRGGAYPAARALLACSGAARVPMVPHDGDGIGPAIDTRWGRPEYMSGRWRGECESRDRHGGRW